MGPIHSRFHQIRQKIEQFSVKYDRDPASIRLIAVSKRHPVDGVVELARLGHSDFGENYLQEGSEKARQAADLLSGDADAKPLCWHFIGHIQSRKCRPIAEHFDWVHTVDSEKVAAKLDHHRSAERPLDVLIQLNLQDESSKSGVAEDQLEPLVSQVSKLPNLRLRGLMIIPMPERDFGKQREVFRHCRHILENINRAGYGLDQLSMGMTDDLEAAIAEGATMVRIGTAIFGPRPT